MSRLPRKLKKKISKDTFYCYIPDDKKNKFRKNPGYWIKSCEFYTHKDGLIGYCNLLHCEIVDQVKECGYREGI
jgi:hypothetical protein